MASWTALSVIVIIAAFGIFNVEANNNSNSTNSTSLLMPGEFKADPMHNGSCMTISWNACDPPSACVVTVTWEAIMANNSKDSDSMDEFHPATNRENTSYTYCLYDTSKVNESCCPNPGSSAKGFDFNLYDYIYIKIKQCLSNERNKCAEANSTRYVAPSKNPCYTRRPCQHGGHCSSTVINKHSCSCFGGRNGTNCEIDPPTAGPYGPTATGTLPTSAFSLVCLLFAAFKLL